MPIAVVCLPLGKVKVELDRVGLNLADRGGFKAEWSNGESACLSEAEYFQMIKTYLKDIYVLQEKQEPSGITLNLAAHQLLDDLKGWTKLNYASQLETHLKAKSQ